jgi:MoaA/NifB/PqqE/SkfB family radical SAM enzyme
MPAPLIKIHPYMFEARSRGLARSEPITNTCNMPSRGLSIDMEGDCYVCHCDAYLPVAVTNILDVDHLADIWQTSAANYLQKNITEQKFTYCAVEHCGILDHSVNLQRYEISVNIDESCNLACPTCRRGPIMHSSGDVYKRRLKMVNHLVSLANEFDAPLLLTMSGNGDPLASTIMRPLVLNWQPKQNQEVKLFTNGLLMDKLLPDSGIFPHIKYYQLSVDAGSQEVYERVRRPGRYNVLRRNLDWLAANKSPDTHVLLFFCLSAANVYDVKNFVDMCTEYGFYGSITKLDNWYTFDDFASQDVANPTHPLHAVALDQLRSVLSTPRITIPHTLTKLL